jgi:hypothetical protein
MYVCVSVYTCVCLPGQTLDSLKLTLGCVQRKCYEHRNATAVASFQVLPRMLRGTRLLHRAKEFGLVTCESLDVDIAGRVGSNIHHPTRGGVAHVHAR